MPSSTFLTDIGCIVSWPQEFTFRPTPHFGPKSIFSEQYGSFKDRMMVPLVPNGNGYDFEIDLRDLQIQGKLNSFNANSASLQVVSAELDGATICNAGTYSIPAED